jgi:hypothetical protein
MRRYQGLAVPKYSRTHECLAYESLQCVEYPGRPEYFMNIFSSSNNS